ncbi:hypothetical protein SAMN05421693_101145 [Ectothiorhodospira magna]|uniref:Lipoprotein LPP20-like domain-containing protein n=1 Tax=Ectothiorhodospira magna TaxID=867345 RepID=A0A1H8Z2J4_9GAMM|nr:LPP20 family lipoprotein [Ectothiorhodospira magna]SEP58487.1 hypothetical protein SAMN05421693_101145 [Ectothiorhodospira magna]
MKKMIVLLPVVMGVMFLNVACAQHYPAPAMAYQSHHFEDRVIRVSGYGAVRPSVHQTQAQLKLNAMRASRLDAYRNLAESVYGIDLQGSTTIRDMAARHDQIRSYVNAKVTGARVVDVILADDDIYETVLELTISRQFYSCVVQPHTCMVPVGAPVRSPAYVAPSVPVYQPAVVPTQCGAWGCVPVRHRAPRYHWQPACAAPHCPPGTRHYNAPYYYYHR